MAWHSQYSAQVCCAHTKAKFSISCVTDNTILVVGLVVHFVSDKSSLRRSSLVSARTHQIQHIFSTATDMHCIKGIQIKHAKTTSMGLLWLLEYPKMTSFWLRFTLNKLVIHLTACSVEMVFFIYLFFFPNPLHVLPVECVFQLHSKMPWRDRVQSMMRTSLQAAGENRVKTEGFVLLWKRTPLPIHIWGVLQELDGPGTVAEVKSS